MNTLYVPIHGSSTDLSGTVYLPNINGAAPLTVTFDYSDELFQQQSATVIKTILNTGISTVKKSATIGNRVAERTTYTTLTGDNSKTACTTSVVTYNTPGVYAISLVVTYGDWKQVTYVTQLTIENTTLSYRADGVTLADDGSVVMSFVDDTQRTNSLCVFKL